MTGTDTAYTQRLNAILGDISANYSGTFSAANNNLYTTLVNRIGLTVINEPDAAINKFAKFSRTTADFGDTIEFVKSKIMKGRAYDPDAPTPFGGDRNIPIAEFDKLNESVQYEIQISEYDGKKAFMNRETLGSFVSGQLSSLQASRAYDQFITWKKFLSDKNKFAGSAYQPLSANTGEAMWKKIREVTQAMRFPSANYNKEGDTAMSGALTLVITADNHRLLDEYLAPIYHKDLLGLTGVDIIDVDSFAAPETSKEIAFEILDDRAPGYYPQTPVASSAYNARSLSTTNFLTVRGNYTFQRYRNAYCALKA